MVKLAEMEDVRRGKSGVGLQTLQEDNYTQYQFSPHESIRLKMTDWFDSSQNRSDLLL